MISLLEPRIVIPMHYGAPENKLPLAPLSKFLKEMGLNQVETIDVLKLSSVNSLPEETRVMVLNLTR